MTPVETTLISVLSIVVGAVIGHFFTSKRQRKSELAEMKLKAYTDFIAAISGLAASRRIGVTEDDLKDLSALNDAKARICICADKAVIEAMTEFWKHGGTLEGEQELQAFKRFCFRVRESLGMHYTDITHLEISDILFKLEPSGYSFRASKYEKNS